MEKVETKNKKRLHIEAAAKDPINELTALDARIKELEAERSTLAMEHATLQNEVTRVKNIKLNAIARRTRMPEKEWSALTQKIIDASEALSAVRMRQMTVKSEKTQLSTRRGDIFRDSFDPKFREVASRMLPIETFDRLVEATKEELRR